MSLPSFKLLRPSTVAEAVEHLVKHAGNIQILAGGTDIIPSMKQRDSGRQHLPGYALRLV